MIGGPIDQGHDFLAKEMGKPLPNDKENGLDQIGPWFQDPIGGAGDFGFGQHRQGEQAEQRIKPGLLAELLQAEPVHASQERRQLERQFGRPQPEAPVRDDNNHLQVLHP